MLTDHLAELLFAPTATAVANLTREGVSEAKIRLVGDVMYDAAIYYGVRTRERSGILKQLGLRPRGYVLATIHRAENTDELQRLRAIVEGLAIIGQEWPVVLPLHPRTRGAVQRAELLEALESRVRVIDPVGYLDMVMLEMQAALVVTDSGGVQKEAFFYQVPCVTLRDETEWVELVELGWNQLVTPTTADAVAQAISGSVGRRGEQAQPYGDGHAAQKIVEHLLAAAFRP